METDKTQFAVKNFAYKDISKISAEAESAITKLKDGNFDEAVALYLQMLSDGRLNSALNSRISGVFSDKISIINSSFPEDDKIIMESLNDTNLKLFWSAFLMLGVGILRVEWILTEGKYLPKISNFLPVGLRYDKISEKYYLIVSQQSEEELDKRVEEIDAANKEVAQASISADSIANEILDNSNYNWIIVNNGNQGHLYGLINALKDDWVSCNSAKIDRDTFNENQNGRIWVINAPSACDQGSRDEFARSLARVKKNSSILCPQGTSEYDSFSVQAIDPTNSSVYESYNQTISDCQTNYAITILGQNLTTEVSGGSFAATESHMQVRKEIINSDKEILFKLLNNVFLRYYREINNANYDGEFLVQIDKSDEINKAIEWINNIILTNESLNSVGKKIDIEKLLSALNIDFVIDA